VCGLSSRDAILSNDGFAWLLNRSSSFAVARSSRALFRLQARSIRLYRDVSTASDARLELMTGRSAQAFDQPDIVGIGPRLVPSSLQNTMEGPESSQGQRDPLSGPQRAAPVSELSKALKTGTEATAAPAAHVNSTAAQANANLPSFSALDAPANAAANLFIPRWHVRAPSSGLTLVTDLPPSTTSTARNTPHNTTNLAATGSEGLRQSATAPIMVDEKYLRTARSSNSLAGSLSPSSAISSPALNALGDLTPLPSPLVMGDSPGPWQRAVARPRGTSTSSRDDNYLPTNRSTLSPSPSLKKKGYQRLGSTSEGATEARIQAHRNSESTRERNRSISEYTPDSLHNPRPRNVTIGSVAAEGDATVQQRLRREQYLASQRGIVPAQVPAGLPTPPASNASNRSITDEEDHVAEDDDTKYIAVRHGSQMKKKLWRPVRQLGQGTFSKVYLATCERTAAKDPLDEKTLDLRKLVAIKVVEHGPAGGADEERVELSLKREVEMLRSVSHPSLVHLRAFDHNEAQALLVLTYCPGGDLFDVASDHRDILSIDIVQRVFAEMVSAVRYLHEKLIVHRDIKLESSSLRSSTLALTWSVHSQRSCTNAWQTFSSTSPSPPYLFSRTLSVIRTPLRHLRILASPVVSLLLQSLPC
jgi:protein-serine/threonine kinase